jgi:tetratricopeptide (TPR) repeat protein
MRCRNYLWAVGLVLFGCTPLFQSKNDFERGIEAYRDKRYAEATADFKAHHKKFPESDSALYYLFSCYKHLNKYHEQISVLEQLKNRKVHDINVYLNLISYYRKDEKYHELYSLLKESPPFVIEDLDRQLTLTRRFFAEIICGTTARRLTTDPLIYCVSRGYLPLFPDGQLYAEDTLTNANLVILLDRLIEADYPRNFYPMKYISTKSYLYLPYMRLVDSGIISFDPYVVPREPAHVSLAVGAVQVLMQRGLFD